MSVTPGHSFGVNETVTSELLLKWIAQANSGIVISAASLMSMEIWASNTTWPTEGQIIFNTNCGYFGVYGRNGFVPVVGKGMFTRRIGKWALAANTLKSFVGTLGLAAMSRMTLPASTVSLTDALLQGFGEDYWAVGLRQANSPSAFVYYPFIIHPSPGVMGAAGEDYTICSCVTGVHHLLQMRGLSLVCSTFASNCTCNAQTCVGTYDLTLMSTATTIQANWVFHRIHDIMGKTWNGMPVKNAVFFVPVHSAGQSVYGKSTGA